MFSNVPERLLKAIESQESERYDNKDGSKWLLT
jgi:hypothetical protein